MSPRPAALLIALLALLLGCQHATPVSPAATATPTEVPAAIPVQNELAPFGLLAIDLDLASLNAAGRVIDLSPRTAQTGLESVNLTSYLGTAPCHDCIRVTSVKRAPTGELLLTIGIRHPFPKPDLTQPASAKNRLDLHVYDVEGVLLFNDYRDKVDFPILGQSAADTFVVNADGWSSYLTPSILEPLGLGLTLYPYKVFFRDYTDGTFDPLTGYADPLFPRGANVMPQGSWESEATYALDLPASGSRRLYLYAQASWGQASRPPATKLAPVYRVPQFCKKAASEVSVAVTANNLEEGVTDSTATVQVQVLDHSEGIAAGPGLAEMKYVSNVDRFDLECPGLVSTRVIVSDPIPTGGDPRDPANPLTYEITVPNSAGAPSGEYRAILRVRDSYPAGQTDAPFNGKDVLDAPGTAADPLANARTLTEYATYAVFTIVVAGTACPTSPVWEANTPPDPVLGLTYSYQFVADNGTGAITYRLKSGTLPHGMTLGSDGLLAGLPQVRADFFTSFPITVEATDSCATPKSIEKSLTLRLNLQPLTFVYFDIGQGHATLLYTAGKAMLIDTGPSDRPRAERIRDYITSHNLDLKYLVGTHFHGDHIGGVAYILCGADRKPGRAGINDDGDATTDDFEDAEEYGWPGSDDLVPDSSFDNENDDSSQSSDRIWVAATQGSHVPWSTTLLNDPTLFNFNNNAMNVWIAAGDRALFTGSNPGADPDDENSNSVVTIISYGGFDTELGGDLVGSTGGGGTNVETGLAQALAGAGQSLDVMLAHHHGSRYSSNDVWLTTLKPEVIMIQCGADNSYGHPHQELLTRIDNDLFSIANPILQQIYMITTGTSDPRTFDGVPIASSPLVTLGNPSDITVVTDGRFYTVTENGETQGYDVDLALP
ncbi:MAG: MBL fold metallo-hydrolase [bacterium]